MTIRVGRKPYSSHTIVYEGMEATALGIYFLLERSTATTRIRKQGKKQAKQRLNEINDETQQLQQQVVAGSSATYSTSSLGEIDATKFFRHKRQKVVTVERF